VATACSPRQVCEALGKAIGIKARVAGDRGLALCWPPLPPAIARYRPVANDRSYIFPFTNSWKTSMASPTAFGMPSRNERSICSRTRKGGRLLRLTSRAALIAIYYLSVTE